MAPFRICQISWGSILEGVGPIRGWRPLAQVARPFWDKLSRWSIRCEDGIPVAGGPRFCPCTLRTCFEESILESEARSSASGDSVDVQLWGLDRDAGCCGLVGDLIVPGKTRDIRGGSPHVDPDRPIKDRSQQALSDLPDDRDLLRFVPASQCIAYHSSGWSTEDTLQTGEVVEVE